MVAMLLGMFSFLFWVVSGSVFVSLLCFKLSFFCLHQILTKDVIHGTTEVSRKRDPSLWASVPRLAWLQRRKPLGRSSDAKIQGRVMPGEEVPGIDYRHSVGMDKSIFSIKVILLIGWTFLEGRWSLLNAKSPACVGFHIIIRVPYRQKSSGLLVLVYDPGKAWNCSSEVDWEEGLYRPPGHEM